MCLKSKSVLAVFLHLHFKGRIKTPSMYKVCHWKKCHWKQNAEVYPAIIYLFLSLRL